MRIIVQRVSQASVTVEDNIVGEIKKGLMVLVGFEKEDTQVDYDYIANKITGLRIFEDKEGKMNLSVQDVFGGVLIIPNFTLYGDVRKGFRPSFTGSAPVPEAKHHYDAFLQRFQGYFPLVESGVFQADMKVALVNDGPVTIMLDSKRLF